MGRNEDIIIKNEEFALQVLSVGVLWGKSVEFYNHLRKMFNFYDFLIAESNKLDNIRQDVISEAKGKRSHVYEACKRVPQYQLLKLANVKQGRASANVNLILGMQTGYCIMGVYVDRVLQQHYRWSIAKRKEYFEWLNAWIDEIWSGHQTLEGVNDMFIEDAGYSIFEGKYVA